MTANKRNTYFAIFKMIEKDLDPETIAEFSGRIERSCRDIRLVFNAVKAQKPIAVTYKRSFSTVLEAASEYLKVPLIFAEEPKPEEPKPEVKEEVKPVAPDNNMLYLIKLLESVHELNEHIGELMDADLPRSVDRIVTAVDATNAVIDMEPVAKAINNMTSVMARTISETMRSGMAEIVSLTKENRNTLNAIKNSCQKMEQRLR